VFLQANRWLAAVLLLAMAINARAGDEAPENTPAEKSYLLLRDSKDTKTQLLAKRWYGLVQLQDWTDATGKFQSTAKYLEQDEKQGTVKLRVIKGSGKDQVVTDRTISVDKLNKECQARVKQIAFLAAKVEEAEKAEAEKAAAPKDGQQATGGMAGPPGAERGGRGMNPGQPPDKMDGPPPRGKLARSDSKDRTKTASAAKDGARDGNPANSRVPQRTPPGAEPAAALPAATAPLPVVAAAAESRATAAPAADGLAVASARKTDPAAVARPAQPAKLPDEKPWRTSFEAFRGNLTAARGRASWELGWGELDALKQAYEKATAQVAATADPNASLSAAELDALGEVAWEVSLTEQPDEQTDWSKALGLALPEPFKIVCKLDSERGPGDWHRFFPGDRVKFIGHFTGFGGGDDFGAVGHIQIAIRFPDDVRDAVPVRKGL
jgi:hypothetical protein